MVQRGGHEGDGQKQQQLRVAAQGDAEDAADVEAGDGRGLEHAGQQGQGRDDPGQGDFSTAERLPGFVDGGGEAAVAHEAAQPPRLREGHGDEAEAGEGDEGEDDEVGAEARLVVGKPQQEAKVAPRGDAEERRGQQRGGDLAQ